MVFRADAGNDRKIVNFTYSLPLCLWKLLSNSYATFNLENVNLLSDPNVNPENGVAYKKTGYNATNTFGKNDLNSKLQVSERRLIQVR